MVQNLCCCCCFPAAIPIHFSSSKGNCSDWSIDASGINLSLVSVDLDSEFESKKRQIAAQSSTLQKGNFVLHALTALSTRTLAAVDRGADATMSTTSSFDKTSQICSQESNTVHTTQIFKEPRNNSKGELSFYQKSKSNGRVQHMLAFFKAHKF